MGVGAAIAFPQFGPGLYRGRRDLLGSQMLRRAVRAPPAFGTAVPVLNPIQLDPAPIGAAGEPPCLHVFLLTWSLSAPLLVFRNLWSHKSRSRFLRRRRSRMHSTT